MICRGHVIRDDIKNCGSEYDTHPISLELFQQSLLYTHLHAYYKPKTSQLCAIIYDAAYSSTQLLDFSRIPHDEQDCLRRTSLASPSGRRSAATRLIANVLQGSGPVRRRRASPRQAQQSNRLPPDDSSVRIMVLHIKLTKPAFFASIGLFDYEMFLFKGRWLYTHQCMVNREPHICSICDKKLPRRLFWLRSLRKCAGRSQAGD